jgi:outer membrane protein assembly factor BamB
MKSRVVFVLLLLLVCIIPSVIAAATEPFPGWKFRGELNNTGQYNDGGFMPNGRELWNVSTISQPSSGMGTIWMSSPSVADGIVYVGDDYFHLFAIYAGNGTIRWRNTLADTVYSSPAVANGMVYVGTGNDDTVPATFYAFNASTGGHGTPVWKKTVPGGLMASPAVANGVVYIGRQDGNVSAWNATTGADVWRYKMGDQVMSSPAVANGVVYVASQTNLTALNATTGALVWNAPDVAGWPASFSAHFSSPAAAYGNVYIGGIHGVYAFNATTGKLLSEFTPTDSDFDSAPAVANGIVYIGTQGRVVKKEMFYALNATNLTQVVWSNTTPDNTDIFSSPALAGGIVYVTSDFGNDNEKGFLYAWNAKTGAPVWSYHTYALSGTYSSPAVADGVVYFGTWFPGLVAVGTEPTTPVVTGISPVSGVRGRTVVISNLSGSNFAAGATVSLSRSGYPSITATRVKVVSKKKITCNFTIPAGAPLGLRNVVVKNPSGKVGTKASAFKVMAPVAPTVASLKPATGKRGRLIWITNLSGTGFVGTPQPKVQILKGSSVITATNVSVGSSRKISCSFAIPAGAATGTWNARVTNGDGQTGTKAGAFSITG